MYFLNALLEYLRYHVGKDSELANTVLDSQVYRYNMYNNNITRIIIIIIIIIIELEVMVILFMNLMTLSW